MVAPVLVTMGPAPPRHLVTYNQPTNPATRIQAFVHRQKYMPSPYP